MTIAPERGEGTSPVDFTITSRIVLNPGGQVIAVGAGTPEAALAAPVGSVYLNSTGTSANTTMYVKRTGTGNTGWFPVTA